MLAQGFAPIAGPGARLLILGSLPGQASLDAREYYAQPRNAFWMIMGALFEAGPSRPYRERQARLIERGVAVWDVCAVAAREGSLDAAIEPHSVRANDFVQFYADFPEIRCVAFNGATAATLYKQHVLPTLSPAQRRVATLTLPSTSPTHAALSLKDKLEQWQVITKKLKVSKPRP
jgi:double-stranded uracil-DNA glycosylase